MAVLDLDLVASRTKSKLELEGLSLRRAAADIGCSASTLSRILLGSKAPNTPDWESLSRVIEWVGAKPSEFDEAAKGGRRGSSFAEVEAHLRALRDIRPPDRDMLVAIVRAAYVKAREQRGHRKG